jgi:hypothetical protein
MRCQHNAWVEVLKIRCSNDSRVRLYRCRACGLTATFGGHRFVGMTNMEKHARKVAP